MVSFPSRVWDCIHVPFLEIKPGVRRWQLEWVWLSRSALWRRCLHQGTSKLSFLREHFPPPSTLKTPISTFWCFYPQTLCFPTLVELVYPEAFLAWSLPLLEFFYGEKNRREQTRGKVPEFSPCSPLLFRLTPFHTHWWLTPPAKSRLYPALTEFLGQSPSSASIPRSIHPFPDSLQLTDTVMNPCCHASVNHLLGFKIMVLKTKLCIGVGMAN